MPSRPVRRQLDEADLLAAVGVVRRYLAGLHVDEDAIDELVQETAARLWENRWRIDRQTAPGYALATARNLLAEQARQADRDRRHQHRLHEPDTAVDGFDAVERAQEHAAVTAAFARLPARDQALLTGHHVDAVSVTDLAQRRGASPGAVAAALNRARGRLRLEYCLQAHRRQLTEDRCRQVLTSVALGNMARQQSLGAGRHLAACPTCGPLAQVLTARDRHAAGLGPLVTLIGVLGWLRRSAAAHPVVASAGGVGGVAGGTAVALILTAAHHPAPRPAPLSAPAPVVQHAAVPPRPAPTTTLLDHTRVSVPAPPHGLLLRGTDILPAAGRTSMLTDAGRAVRAVDVAVLAVDAGKGFWVGTPAHRLWVQRHAAPSSAPRAGDLVSFAGRITANPAGFTASIGLTDQEGADLVDAQRVHVDLLTTPLHRRHPAAVPNRH